MEVGAVGGTGVLLWRAEGKGCGLWEVEGAGEVGKGEVCVA